MKRELVKFSNSCCCRDSSHVELSNMEGEVLVHVG